MVTVEGKELPQAVAYASRRFSPTEARWPLCEREGYGQKFVFERFHQLLEGLPIVIETDHKNHLFMHNAVSMKVQRWRLYMQQFNYEIRHLEGVKNEIADGMSRIFEDISSLHISNLMRTAPTCEQARIERQQGIISPSTFLRGAVDPDVSSCTQCGDEDGPDGPDGEGGSDEALFNMVTARLCGIEENAYRLPVLGCLTERRCILRTQSASSRQLLLMFGIPQYSERAITTHRLTHRSLFPIPYLPLALRNNPAELTSVGNCSMVASTDFPRQPHDFPAGAHI